MSCFAGRLRTSLIVHRKLHTGLKEFICNLCGKAFAFKQKVCTFNNKSFNVPFNL